MKKLKENQEILKIRSLRLSENSWKSFTSLKQRGKSWEVFIKEFVDIVKVIKNWDENN
jgi:hypothetical protein